jgi:rubredoxin
MNRQLTRRGALRALGSLGAGLAVTAALGGCGDSDSGPTPEQAEAFRAYQCGNADCGYVYDPMAGEEDRGHEAGTPFKDLPGDYACPMCGTPKSKFTPYEPKN